MEKNLRSGFEIKILFKLLKREIGSSGSGKYVANAAGTDGFVIESLMRNADHALFHDIEHYRAHEGKGLFHSSPGRI